MDEMKPQLLDTGWRDPATRWLVAVSGGGDSVALLRLLWVEPGLRERLVVGHFQHGWGAFGTEAEAWVRRWAAGLGARCVVGQGTGRAATNAEAVARAERWAWLGAQARELGLTGVLVGHTADDAVEQVLLRLGKGSGLVGLSSFGAVGQVPGWADLRLGRPLLGVARADLRAYLRGIGQDWLDDPADAGQENQRAKLRALMPALAAAGVPAHGILASVQALQRAQEVVVQAVSAWWATRQELGGGVQWERAVWLAAPTEVNLQGMARAIGSLRPGAQVPRTSKRLALLQRIVAEEQGVGELGGCRWAWDPATVRVL